MLPLIVDLSQVVAAVAAGAALWLNLRDRVARDRPNLRILSGRIVLGRPDTVEDPVLTTGSSGPARLVNFGGGPAVDAIVSVDSVHVDRLGQYNVRPNHLALHDFGPVGNVHLGALPRHGPFLIQPSFVGSFDPLPSALASRIGEIIFAAVLEPFPFVGTGPISRLDPQIEFRASVRLTVTYRDRTERRRFSQEFNPVMVGVCSFLGTRPSAFRVVAYLMNATEATEDFILSRDERIMYASQRETPQMRALKAFREQERLFEDMTKSARQLPRLVAKFVRAHPP